MYEPQFVPLSFVQLAVVCTTVIRTSSPLLVALLAIVLLPALVVAAEDQADGRRPYVRFQTGIGVTADSDLRIRQPALGTDLTFERVSWEHRSLSTEWTRDSIPYAGVRTGFFFRRPSWLGLSFEVRHFKILAETEKRVHVTGTDEGTRIDVVAPMDRFIQLYRVTNGVNMILTNVQAHKGLVKSERFPRGQAELYGGVGAGVTVPYTSSQIDAGGRRQYDWGRPATQVLGGVAWSLFPRWDLSFEYAFTLTTVDGSVAQGDSRSRLRTNHVAFGFGYHFASPAERHSAVVPVPRVDPATSVGWRSSHRLSNPAAAGHSTAMQYR